MYLRKDNIRHVRSRASLDAVRAQRQRHSLTSRRRCTAQQRRAQRFHRWRAARAAAVERRCGTNGNSLYLKHEHGTFFRTQHSFHATARLLLLAKERSDRRR